MIKTKQIGDNAEDKARLYLQNQGLTFVAANIHSRYGELDLVMKDKAYWVAVEVKFRRSTLYGNAMEFVTSAKLAKIRLTFEQYLIRQGLNPASTPMRIDVIAVNSTHLDWLQNVEC
ncbi:YraN family protein [Alteromonas sp. ASW11-130]|uniref:YraN family protein n=1 Tax=Alteromonas sp. ASW11-130 TaxID=3015775 RepID=UPI002241F040|nr:YraN family protein [Alteromonas sp. ASW11-130]